MNENYHIALYTHNGDPIPMRLSPTWYGISEDVMIGLCIGLLHGSGRKTAEARAYKLNPDGSKGELIRVQH